MVGDYMSTSFAGGNFAFPVFAVAKAKTGTVFDERMYSARFDVTMPSSEPLVRARKDPIRFCEAQLRARSRASSGPLETTPELIDVGGVGEKVRRARSVWTAVAVAALGVLFVATVSAGSVIPTPISDDPYTDAGSAHQHKTQVEPDSFAFGQTIVALTQSGRWFSGGGSSNLVFSSSQNGGRTWTTGGLPGTTINSGGPWPRISDPSVAFDPQDNVWLALGLGIDAGGSGHILLVNRSTDGGVTWSNPVTAGTAPGTFWDKTWITCDTWAQSPHYGNCYIEFDDASAGDRMSMVTSTDGGVTWGSVLSPPGCSSGLGGQPVVQPNGNVIVPYSNDGGAESSFRSTNGGTTWGDCGSSPTSPSTAWPRTSARSHCPPPRSRVTARSTSPGRTAVSARTAARTTSSTAHRWTA